MNEGRLGVAEKKCREFPVEEVSSINMFIGGSFFNKSYTITKKL